MMQELSGGVTGQMIENAKRRRVVFDAEVFRYKSNLRLIIAHLLQRPFELIYLNLISPTLAFVERLEFSTSSSLASQFLVLV